MRGGVVSESRVRRLGLLSELKAGVNRGICYFRDAPQATIVLFCRSAGSRAIACLYEIGSAAVQPIGRAPGATSVPRPEGTHAFFRPA